MYVDTNSNCYIGYCTDVNKPFLNIIYQRNRKFIFVTLFWLNKYLIHFSLWAVLFIILYKKYSFGIVCKHTGWCI